MIKRFDGFKEEAVTPSKQLPAGSYVIEIKGVKFIQGEGNKSDRIEMAIDIAEGEQAGFYKEQFDASTDEDKKWKGKATIWMPDGSNSDADKRAVRNFNSFAAFLANENAGYHWDWDEQKLKGKKIGGTFRREWNVDDTGREFNYTAFAWFCSADDVRNGKARPANDKFRNGATGKVYTKDAPPSGKNEGFMDIPDTDAEEIPF